MDRPAEGDRALSMNAMCRAEVEQLHTFLEGWLGGTLPATADAFRRFRDVMAAEFEIISPDGRESIPAF